MIAIPVSTSSARWLWPPLIIWQHGAPVPPGSAKVSLHRMASKSPGCSPSVGVHRERARLHVDVNSRDHQRYEGENGLPGAGSDLWHEETFRPFYCLESELRPASGRFSPAVPRLQPDLQECAPQAQPSTTSVRSAKSIGLALSGSRSDPLDQVVLEPSGHNFDLEVEAGSQFTPTAVH